MRFTIVQHAAPHERFATGCFDSMIGCTIPVNLRETDDSPIIAEVGHAVLTAAEVAEDGSSVTLTFDRPEDTT